ncbi:hypothetical protein Cyagr_2594 [Cyanobium gracile PCC 6307]|uniref:Uncharacterized protein n=1 Tax=Cyanobium gracile (strain ATCC 27147 / PCC 6307) TaxID=292564 RepID=K9P9Q5_CYAGP|nr:hypothetical protein Cyagr_2594 [Cyanobium gracile PCC 6307]
MGTVQKTQTTSWLDRSSLQEIHYQKNQSND